MPARLKAMWSAAPIATVLLIVSLLVAAAFGVRLTAQWVYWHDPARQEQVVEGWMTPGYVANSWHVPRDLLIEELGIERRPGRPLNLRDLAQSRGVPLDVLIDEVNAAVAAIRASAPEGRP